MDTKIMQKMIETIFKKWTDGQENKKSELIKLSYTELYMLFLNTEFTEKEFKELCENEQLKNMDNTLAYLIDQVKLANEQPFTVKKSEDEYVSMPIFDSISQGIDGYSFRINKNVLKYLTDANSDPK